MVYEPAVPLVAGFHVTGDPIPASALFTDKTKSKPGLEGALFKDATFTGNPTDRRADAQLNLFWNEAQPVTGLPVTGVNARWTGVLAPPVSGDYILSFKVNGGCRFTFDGQKICDQIRSRGTSVFSRKVTLEAGRTYALSIDYTQANKDGKIQLGWQAPGADKGIERALAAARDADHILLTLGITPELEGEEMRVDAEGFAGGDRTSILLPKSQRDLIDRNRHPRKELRRRADQWLGAQL